MKLSNFYLFTSKEKPADAHIESHKLMIRAGMIRQASAGIYNWLPFGLLALKNIENIIVLAGSEDISSTIKTNKLNLNEGSERLITSISLANKHIGSKIYFVGGNGYIVNDNLSELDVAKKFYSELKFDLNRIIYIGGTRNTIENLIEIKKLNFDPSTSILVTSAFHMKRSMMISEKIGLKLMPYAVDFRSISNKSFLNIYQRYSISANLSDFDLFIREIIGILAFKILI